MISLEKNQSIIGVQEDIMEFPSTDNLKTDNPQSSDEKLKKSHL